MIPRSPGSIFPRLAAGYRRSRRWRRLALLACTVWVSASASAQLPGPGSVDAGFNANTDKTVGALAVSAAGQTVLAGGFTQVNGIPHGNVARLNPDGSLDPAFNAVTDATTYGESVNAVAVRPDGRVLLAGHFTQVNGVPRVGLAGLNEDGSLDPTFNATLASIYSGPPYLNAVTVQPDGKVLAGGWFTFVNGVAHGNVARLNADGSLDATFNAGTDGYISSVAVQPDGKVLLAGSFGKVNGVAHGNVARLNPDGSLDSTFQTNVSGGLIFTLAALPDGRIMLGGEFTQVNGVARHSLARLNADGSLDAGFNADIVGPVLALAVTPDGGRIVLGGVFFIVNGTGRTNVARLLADGSLDPGFFASAYGGNNAAVLALGLTADGKLLLGGRFAQVDGTAHPNVARLLGGAGTPGSPPVVSGAISLIAVVGQPFSYPITASNAPAEYGAQNLPAGLSVDRVTGLISGTPTATGTFPVTLYATNGAGTGTENVVLSVIFPPAVPVPVITAPPSAGGQINQAFTYQIAATNAPMAFDATGLPAGLSVNPATGLISGVPTVSGSFTVTLSATNAGGRGTALLGLVILPPPAVPPPVAAITSPLAAGAQVGQPFLYQISATNQPIRFAATGLPPGLDVDNATGLIRGTPTLEGTFPVVLAALNAGGTGLATLTLNVAPMPGAPSVVTVGVDLSTVSRGAGQAATVTFTRAGGDLSGKLTVSYVVTGPLLGGNDYVTLAGTKKIKAGKTSAVIPIVPLAGGADGKVKLTVIAAEGYIVGNPAKVKVKLTE